MGSLPDPRPGPREVPARQTGGVGREEGDRLQSDLRAVPRPLDGQGERGGASRQRRSQGEGAPRQQGDHADPVQQLPKHLRDQEEPKTSRRARVLDGGHPGHHGPLVQEHRGPAALRAGARLLQRDRQHTTGLVGGEHLRWGERERGRMEKNQEEETRELTETEALCARLLREEMTLTRKLRYSKGALKVIAVSLM